MKKAKFDYQEVIDLGFKRKDLGDHIFFKQNEQKSTHFAQNVNYGHKMPLS